MEYGLCKTNNVRIVCGGRHAIGSKMVEKLGIETLII